MKFFFHVLVLTSLARKKYATTYVNLITIKINNFCLYELQRTSLIKQK